MLNQRKKTIRKNTEIYDQKLCRPQIETRTQLKFSKVYAITLKKNNIFISFVYTFKVTQFEQRKRDFFYLRLCDAIYLFAVD